MRFKTFGAPAIGGVALWAGYGQPGAGFGLLAILAALFLLWPPILILTVIALPYALAAPGRGIREWWRGGAPRAAQRSSRIPALMRRAVLAADQRRCVYCGSGHEPQIDHAVPWRRGGLSLLPNLFVLCARHNRVKSDFYMRRDGTIVYNPFPGAADARKASAMLVAERRVRWRLVRWLRAAWAMS